VPRYVVNEREREAGLRDEGGPVEGANVMLDALKGTVVLGESEKSVGESGATR
jgi:hypothetical protein